MCFCVWCASRMYSYTCPLVSGEKATYSLCNKHEFNRCKLSVCI